MEQRIKHLHLMPGDIILVRDQPTLVALSDMKLNLGFHVPLVFSPQGIEVLKREDILNLLEQLDQTYAPTPSFTNERITQPL